MRLIQKPRPGEYPPYADMYLRLTADDGRILEQLNTNFLATRDFIHTPPEERLRHRYAPGKWSIKAIVVHTMSNRLMLPYTALPLAPHEKLQLKGTHHKP